MKKKLHENIVEIIGGMIESGDLAGGDKLPPERSLAKTYNVSRNTIREAIKVLAEKQVLVSKLGAGTFVAKSAVESLEASLLERLEQKRHRLLEIFELRSLLEPQIAGLASQRIGPEDLKRLGQVLDLQEEALKNGESTSDCDKEFHSILAKASGNTILCRMYDKLQHIFNESRSEELQSTRRKKESMALHKEIYNAVKNKDAETATLKMKQHMTWIEKSLETSLTPETFRKDGTR